MSDYLHVAQSICGCVSIPVIADCDTGYGNAANVVYAVKKFEAAGAAAISIEDQVFPKTNSLIRGPKRLVSISEFTHKIRAAKQAQRNPDFVVIARVEALMADAGQGEAQLRATAYADAGADAILIHWNQSSAEPIRRFLREWNHPTPIIVVPTTYYQISLQELSRLGARMVIYANHGMRSALYAMEEAFEAILADGTTAKIEHSLWPVTRVLEDLQGIQNGGEQCDKDGIHSDPSKRLPLRQKMAMGD